MENEGARFGEAVGLDSVSTFECIVEGFNHFFMEMNTRIQVEHGVTELVYRLRFTNPDDPEDCFYVDELIEAMALLALHGARLPDPERVTRAVSGVEVRINATNQALQPHAGGLIRGWSKPIPGEIRFDQGIGARNPDTGSFIYYSLAGAYDSNVALLLTDGDSRRHNYERMADVLRCMELRGDDLQTNAPMHYGLISWFLGKGPMAEPDTRFMASYLAAVGALAQLARDIDLELAASEIARRAARRRGARDVRREADAARAPDPAPARERARARRVPRPLRGRPVDGAQAVRAASRGERSSVGWDDRCSPTTRSASCASSITTSRWRRTRRRRRRTRSGPTTRRSWARRRRSTPRSRKRTGARWSDLDGAVRRRARRSARRQRRALAGVRRGASRPPARPRDPARDPAPRRALGLLERHGRRDAQGRCSRRASSTRRRRRSA